MFGLVPNITIQIRDADWWKWADGEKWLQNDFGRCEIDPINIIYGEQTVSNRRITVYSHWIQAEKKFSNSEFRTQDQGVQKFFNNWPFLRAKIGIANKKK